MIDVIGNIKIDETKSGMALERNHSHIRVKYLVASLLSYDFLAESRCSITILFNEPSFPLVNLLKALPKELKCTFTPLFPSIHSDYGVSMRTMLKESDKPYYLQFEEDHFCHLNDPEVIRHLLDFAQRTCADIIRSSFFDVETISAQKMKPFAWHETGRCYEMHQENFRAFNHKWPRFYLGTNCIFSKEFAQRFYGRPGQRPHDYELAAYTPAFKHNCLVPAYEILRSIDDDHDTPETCMLKQPTNKFLECMRKAEELMKKYYN